MRRNHKLESKLAEEIVGYVLVNTEDYFAAEKQLELAQQTNNKQSTPCSCNGPVTYTDVAIVCDVCGAFKR
jgi:hypothetical protein